MFAPASETDNAPSANETCACVVEVKANLVPTSRIVTTSSFAASANNESTLAPSRSNNPPPLDAAIPANSGANAARVSRCKPKSQFAPTPRMMTEFVGESLAPVDNVIPPVRVKRKDSTVRANGSTFCEITSAPSIGEIVAVSAGEVT